MTPEEKKEQRKQRRLERKQKLEAESDNFATGKEEGKESIVLPKGNHDRLLTAERNKFEKMIERRGELLQQSLLNELTLDATSINEQVKKRHGIARTSQQIKEEIKAVKRQIEDACRGEMSKQDSSLAIQIEEMEEEESIALERLEADYKSNKELLKSKFKEQRDAVQSQRNALREHLSNNICPDLITKTRQLEQEEQKISATSNQIESESRIERNIRVKQKDKLLGIVNDTIARAIEQIWATESREEAVKILNSIPTVSEIVMLFRQQTQDAMRELFNRLMAIQARSVGQLQLCAPEELFNQQFSTINEQEQVVEEPVDVDEDEDEDEDEEDNHNHSEDTVAHTIFTRATG